MFLGFDDSLKELKRELKDAGVDMAVVRDWQKDYDRVRRQMPTLEQQYQSAKRELQSVLSVLKGMEQYLISNKGAGDFTGYAKELKRYQGHFNHEFLISKEDTDFHSTYAGIISMIEKGQSSDGLILQSEVENLIALTQEALEKEWPSFYAMAFYYIERSDKEIFDLPHTDKVAKVERVYANEFIKPLRECMEGRIRESRIREIVEEELWKQ